MAKVPFVSHAEPETAERPFLTVRELVAQLQALPENLQDAYIDMNPGFCSGIANDPVNHPRAEECPDASGYMHTFVNLVRSI